MSNKAAFFDLDLTLTGCDTFRLFLNVYYMKSPARFLGLLTVFIYGVLRKLRLISLKSFKEAAMVSLKGKSEADILAIGQSYYESYIACELREDALRELVNLKSQGYLTYLITASPNIYVAAVASNLGFDGFISTDLEYVEGVFTGRISGEDCLGEQKKIRIKALASELDFDLGESIAYSDHDADLHMLECVGSPIAVSPTDHLRKVALQKGWKVVEW